MKHSMRPKNNNQQSQIDFHGASIIDESGNEIPITESMLQHSFRVLIKAWEQAREKQELLTTLNAANLKTAKS